MIVAIIKDDKVVNIIVCDSLELAQELLPGAVCINGDGLAIGEAYPPENPEPGENS